MKLYTKKDFLAPFTQYLDIHTVFRHSFFVKTIPVWNSPQDETVKSTTAEKFKSRLKSEHRQYSISSFSLAAGVILPIGGRFANYWRVPDPEL